MTPPSPNTCAPICTGSTKMGMAMAGRASRPPPGNPAWRGSQNLHPVPVDVPGRHREGNARLPQPAVAHQHTDGALECLTPDEPCPSTHPAPGRAQERRPIHVDVVLPTEPEPEARDVRRAHPQTHREE